MSMPLRNSFRLDHLLTQQPDGSGSGPNAALGDMPEWNLGDLYAGPDAPEIAADIEKARAHAATLQGDYQGKLVEIASDGDKLAEAIAAYEDLAELMGRLGTYAGLYYAGDQSDGARAKFYGDTVAALTDVSRNLIFIELELNQIDEAVLDKALDESQSLARYRPWLHDLRKEK